jgi:hypothetical protein
MLVFLDFCQNPRKKAKEEEIIIIIILLLLKYVVSVNMSILNG